MLKRRQKKRQSMQMHGFYLSSPWRKPHAVNCGAELSGFARHGGHITNRRSSRRRPHHLGMLRPLVQSGAVAASLSHVGFAAHRATRCPLRTLQEVATRDGVQVLSSFDLEFIRLELVSSRLVSWPPSHRQNQCGASLNLVTTLAMRHRPQIPIGCSFSRRACMVFSTLR